MNHHDGIEPYKFSLSLRNDVIEIVLLHRRQDGCIYCVTELVDLFCLRQLREQLTSQVHRLLFLRVGHLFLNDR